jgi:hypothetical protein
VGISQKLAKRGKVLLKNPVQTLGTAVVPLLGLLQGRFLAYLGTVHLWDIAGCLALLLRYDFSVTVCEDSEVRRVSDRVDDYAYHLAPDSRKRWSLRSDLLVCHPDDEEEMRAALVNP